MTHPTSASGRAPRPALLDVAARFGRLGLTGFGGPVAHLGLFHREFVERARWLDDASYAEIVALCSALPGPTSSQVGLSLGYLRAGPAGALTAWLAFTTPSAVVMTLAGLAVAAGHATRAATTPDATAGRGALAGLEGVAAAVVTVAAVTLARRLAATPARATIAGLAFAATVAATLRGVAIGPVLALVAGMLVGAAALRGAGTTIAEGAVPLHVPPRAGVAAALAFIVLLLVAVAVPAGGALGLAAVFVRAGSLVFGGGHVVLPFLEDAIPPSLVEPRLLLAGYGAAQSLPGPLFTFAAYLGVIARTSLSGVAGAALATIAIFAPSFALVPAAAALWSRVRRLPRAGAALAGANAAVVGLLAAVLVDPIAPALRATPLAALVALPALAALTRTRLPAWAVAIGGAGAGAIGALASPALSGR